MEFINTFISTYGVAILGTILTAVASILGVQLKKLYQRYCDTKTKQDVVATCVKAIEQLYTDLHGEDKYNECAKNVSEMLAEKGITVSDLELKMLVESAVKEFNEALK